MVVARGDMKRGAAGGINAADVGSVIDKQAGGFEAAARDGEIEGCRTAPCEANTGVAAEQDGGNIGPVFESGVDEGCLPVAVGGVGVGSGGKQGAGSFKVARAYRLDPKNGSQPAALAKRGALPRTFPRRKARKAALRMILQRPP